MDGRDTPGVDETLWDADVVLSDGGTMHVRPIEPGDAELIQRFVDHNAKWAGKGCIEADMEWDAIVSDCIAAGFKPSKP